MVERHVLQAVNRWGCGRPVAQRRVGWSRGVGLCVLAFASFASASTLAASLEASAEPIAGIGLRPAGSALRVGIQFGEWGTRVGLARLSTDPSLNSPVTTRLSWQWLSDYRFAPTWGLRATGGLLGRVEAGSPAPALLGAGGPGALRIGGSRVLGLIDSALPVSGGEGAWTTPYLGLGYDLTTRLRNGWGGLGLSAELGLVSRRSLGGAGLRVNGEAYDESVRGVRVTPVLQLGVSYSF